ncbi:S-adenosyl-L-methionine-dependent methyltransferase [Lasiosphaeria miniovina]|uniref:S-adenosyl-L-methionine-dependent methyltransferase n=1 Tax=Lasiosphaeria miniovina TaxID=1954250 RepID=A0AA40EAW5_9PEZI|nr:S-adenosyl-L-methionine-dependent methyltransferase [Lasiosphaeria miniovina]KAK0728748.1 S-adenosyl-L-methionine-dependent methyltransferase [Lasiosphaeria miniovina]
MAKSPKAPSPPAGGASTHVSPGSAPADEANVLVEAEDAAPDDDDSGSDYSSIGGSSATTSVASSYLLPNDETEQERLDLTHHVFCLLLNGALCVTQLEKPQNILDIGTGTGIWAIDISDLHPSATCTPQRLAPLSDRDKHQPEPDPDAMFQVDDATPEWMFPPDHFDFIHARTLGGAIRDWPALLSSCFEHCRPGGHVELVEGRPDFWCDDGSLTDMATAKWLAEFRRLAASLDFDIAPKLPALLAGAGFVDVTTTQRVVPLGTSPKDAHLKEVGRWFRTQFIDMALEAYSLALFTRAGGWANIEFQVLLAKVREELKTNKIHLYTYTAFVTGRKPEASS